MKQSKTPAGPARGMGARVGGEDDIGGEVVVVACGRWKLYMIRYVTNGKAK